MIVNRWKFNDLTVFRAATHLARIFLARTTKGATPISSTVGLTFVRREQKAIDNEQFTAPTTSDVMKLSIAWGA